MMLRRLNLGCLACLSLGIVLASQPNSAIALQAFPNSAQVEEVGPGNQRLELSVGGSRVLRFPYDVPRVQIEETTVGARPVSPNEIMIQGVRAGAASLYVYDPRGQIQTIEILVANDIRPLTDALESLFPTAQVRIRPLNQSVVVTGQVASVDQAAQIMEVTRDFFPTAMNHLQVDGNHKVLLNAKVFEVSRTKLRQAGVDFTAILGDDLILSNPGGSIDTQLLLNDSTISGQSSVIGSVGNGENRFAVLLDLLEQNNMAKILADTQLVADSGRVASLLSGGEVPIPISNGLATTIEFREFGTSLDCVPIVQEDGLIRLEILAQVRDVAGDLRDSVTGTPGFRTRNVNTAVTVPAGKTIAIAGIIQNRTDAELRGVPYLMDMPWVGGLFRRTVQTFNEVDLVVVIRPEFVGAVDPCELPDGPGTSSVQPNDLDLYYRGYIESPSVNPHQELGPILPFQPHDPVLHQGQPPHESLPPIEPNPADASSTSRRSSGPNSSDAGRWPSPSSSPFTPPSQPAVVQDPLRPYPRTP